MVSFIYAMWHALLWSRAPDEEEACRMRVSTVPLQPRVLKTRAYTKELRARNLT